ncbi:MAG: winged helix-turn-helix transcriptional regulator [Elusimicrobia bacterium]|nr:winged helix-turn-helix transcriptional regulator [Elusimicrobiota bacterium]
MHTKTRSKIYSFILEFGQTRPADLAAKLKITPQAVHRHLRALLAEGSLERRGRGPKTRYTIAGAPELRRAATWCSAASAPANSPADAVCETRDVFAARLTRLGALTAQGLPESELPLVIAAAGEIGNNCFDHNLGNWRDVPGCWFEAQTTGGRLWLCLADRGQGIFRTLRRADPTIPDEQAAVEAAFERTLSGRAPENRGNGLKFVRNIVLGSEKRGLACRSGGGLVEYGRLGPACRKELAGLEARGTITLLLWSLE